MSSLFGVTCEGSIENSVRNNSYLYQMMARTFTPLYRKKNGGILNKLYIN